MCSMAPERTTLTNGLLTHSTECFENLTLMSSERTRLGTLCLWCQIHYAFKDSHNWNCIGQPVNIERKMKRSEAFGADRSSKSSNTTTTKDMVTRKRLGQPLSMHLKPFKAYWAIELRLGVHTRNLLCGSCRARKTYIRYKLLCFDMKISKPSDPISIHSRGLVSPWPSIVTSAFAGGRPDRAAPRPA